MIFVRYYYYDFYGWLRVVFDLFCFVDICAKIEIMLYFAFFCYINGLCHSF